MIFGPAVVGLLIGFATPGVPAGPLCCELVDTVRAPRIAGAAVSDSLPAGGGDDSSRAPRPHSVEISEWYYRRLTIHRYMSYAVIPVFALQYAAGVQLWDKSRDAPTWAQTGHRVGATLLVGMFGANTVTGLWNLWDSRSVPQHRVLRTAHALMMLTTDAAFSYAGGKLAVEAETNLDKRRLHQEIALTGIGVTMANGLMMKLFNK